MDNKTYEVIILKNIHELPDANSNIIGECKPGELITVDNNVKGWLHIVDGGYVFSGFGNFAREKLPDGHPRNRRQEP